MLEGNRQTCCPVSPTWGVALPRGESGLAASAGRIFGLNLGGLRALLIVRCSGGRGTLVGLKVASRLGSHLGGLRVLLLVRRSGGRGTLVGRGRARRACLGGLRALLIVRRSGGRGTLANLALET